MTLYYFAGYPVDAVLSAGHDAASDVTDFETEDGANFSDHIRNKPLELTFTVLVSNSPVAEIASLREDPVGGSITAEAFAVFTAIRDGRAPISIEAPLTTYDDMALTQLSIPQEVEDGESLRFEVSFKQIKVQASQRTTAAIPRARAPRRAAGTPGNPIRSFGDSVVLVHNPTTGEDAYYYPDSKTFVDRDLNVIKNPAGFVEEDFDPTTRRWVDANTGKPFQDSAPVPPVPAIGTTAPTDPAPWWWGDR